MEEEEQGDARGDHTCPDVRGHDEEGDLVVKARRVRDRPLDHGVRRERDQVRRDRAVQQHVHEELVIVEADAICDPRAVVVHLQDAPVALRAVVAPVGLGLVAPLANAHATEAPPLDGLVPHHAALLGALARPLSGAIDVVGRGVLEEGALRGGQVAQVLVHDLARVPLVALDHRVGELLAGSALLVGGGAG